MGADIIFLSVLPWMPDMVQKLLRIPHFSFAQINQPKRHVIGTANVTEIINVLIRAADFDQVLPQGSHARAVIAGVEHIFCSHKPVVFPLSQLTQPAPMTSSIVG